MYICVYMCICTCTPGAALTSRAPQDRRQLGVLRSHARVQRVPIGCGRGRGLRRADGGSCERACRVPGHCVGFLALCCLWLGAVLSLRVWLGALCVHACMHICMHACMHTNVHTWHICKTSCTSECTHNDSGRSRTSTSDCIPGLSGPQAKNQPLALRPSPIQASTGA